MNRKNNIKMSTLDNLIPKYYKGYDMDILIRKIFNKEPVSEEEKKLSVKLRIFTMKSILKKTEERQKNG